MAKDKKEKLLTPGNIILGVIIIALIASIFIDFSGDGKQANAYDDIGCPQPIKGLIASNVAYMSGETVITEDRLIKPEPNETGKYSITGILRNIGEEDILIRNLLLTKVNLGSGDVIELTMPLLVKANSIAPFDIKVPSGDYHKIDMYSTPCEGMVLFHELGEGAKYQWEIDLETGDEEVEVPEEDMTNLTETNTTE